MNLSEELRTLRARVDSIPEDGKRSGAAVARFKNRFALLVCQLEQELSGQIRYHEVREEVSE